MQRKSAGLSTRTTKKNKGTSHVHNELEKIMHCDVQELLKYIRRHKTYTRVPREECLRETRKAPIKRRWAETEQGTIREAQCAREVRHAQGQNSALRRRRWRR